MSADLKDETLFPETAIGQCREGCEVRLVLLSAKDGLRLAGVFSRVNPWADYQVPLESLERYLTSVDAGAPRLGIVVGGQVVGAAGLCLNWLRGPYLQFLAIEPKFQRRGLGGLVLGWLETEARSRSRANLWVMVSCIDGSARPFYEAHGFVKECEISDVVVEGRDESLMRKRLTN